MADNELEGNTLYIYAYIARENRPVGTRDVTRGANLSSPSVAFRHLQKLEAQGLLEKNEYGEYVVIQKVSISGHIWIGRNLVPRLMCYSLFFMAVLGTELVIMANQVFVQGKGLSIDLIYLAVTNGIATFLFLAEGLRLKRKNKLEQ